MARTKPPHWDDLLMCDCARCGVMLHGVSPEAVRRAELYYGPVKVKALRTVAARVAGRPVCGECRDEK